MQVLATARYLRAYKKLPKQVREKTKKAIQQLMTDMAHPGLQVKRIRGTKDIYEARVDRGVRFTFEINNDNIILRNVGEHDKTLSNP